MAERKLSKETILKTLQDNGASYFASLLSDATIQRLFKTDFTLFVPTNDFYTYLCSDIPEKREMSSKDNSKPNKYLSIETLLQNPTIKETVSNHVFSGHLKIRKPESHENLRMLSRLVVRYEILWNRERRIDGIPFVGEGSLGRCSKNKRLKNVPSLNIYYIDGILANEDQYDLIYQISE